jgi:phage-related protein
MLRGGAAGGSSATKRKRNEKAIQNDALTRLCNLLEGFVGTSPQKNLQKKKKKKKKSAIPNSSAEEGPKLVDQLNKVVEGIRKDPASLVPKLEAFLKIAKASGLGRQANVSGTSARQGSWADVVKQNTASAKVAPVKRGSQPITLARHCWPLGEVRDYGKF